MDTITTHSTTGGTPFAAERAAAQCSPATESAELTAFRERASRRHGRITLAVATLAAPATTGALIASRALRGDPLGARAVVILVVATVAVIGLFAFIARRGMTPPKYAYLGTLDAPTRTRARRDLRETTPNDDPVVRFAETQRATWAKDSGWHFYWAAPMLAAILVLAGWAGWEDWGWLSNLPMWIVLAHSAWRLGLAARERSAAVRYLEATTH